MNLPLSQDNLNYIEFASLITERNSAWETRIPPKLWNSPRTQIVAIFKLTDLLEFMQAIFIAPYFKSILNDQIRIVWIQRSNSGLSLGKEEADVGHIKMGVNVCFMVRKLPPPPRCASSILPYCIVFVTLGCLLTTVSLY